MTLDAGLSHLYSVQRCALPVSLVELADRLPDYFVRPVPNVVSLSIEKTKWQYRWPDEKVVILLCTYDSITSECGGSCVQCVLGMCAFVKDGGGGAGIPNWCLHLNALYVMLD